MNNRSSLMEKLAKGIFWLGSLRLKSLTEEEIRKACREAVERGVDIVDVRSYTCTRDYGGAPDEEFALFYPSRVLPVAKNLERDLLKLQVDIAHEFGLITRTYLNAHWYGINFYEKHKDWAQIKADGSSIDNLYGHGYSMCVNTDYKERMVKLVLDVAKRGVDIIFLDGPAYYPGACYCNSCKEKFYEIYGEDIPKEEDWNDPLWRRFIKFRYRSLANFLVSLQRALQSSGFKTLLYSNTSGQTWPVWHFALSMEELWEGESILAAESYQYYTRTIGIPVWLYGWTAKYGNSVKRGKPFCLFLSGAHAPWTYYRIPEVERKLATFQGLANGANILEYYEDVMKDLVKLVKRWNKYFEGIKSIANVALLWSRSSADFMYDEPRKMITEVTFEAQAVQVEQVKPPANVKSESLKRYVEEVRGFYEMLIRLHVPFDLISDLNLTSEDLKKYDVLILPSSLCMSENQVKAIENFVENGGGLIASYEVSLRNEYGDPLDNFALSKVLGVEYLGKIYGPLPWDYMKLVKKHSILEGVPMYSRASEDMLPSPEYCLTTKPYSEDYVLAYQMTHMASRYAQLGDVTELPTIVALSYGKGKVVYFTGNFGGQYWGYGFLDYVKIIGNSLKWVSSVEFPARLRGSESVEMTVYRGDSWYLIFLANYNFVVRRPFCSVNEASNLSIKVKTDFTPSRVRALVQERDLGFKLSEGFLTIALPKIGEYEIILIGE